MKVVRKLKSLNWFVLGALVIGGVWIYKKRQTKGETVSTDEMGGFID